MQVFFFRRVIGPDGSVVERPLREWEVAGFESRPRHNNGVNMVPVITMLGAQHYKASTGSPLTHYYHY